MSSAFSALRFSWRERVQAELRAERARQHSVKLASSFHFVASWPPRYVLDPAKHGGAGWMTCDRCGVRFPLWNAPRSVWRLLPRRLHKSILCAPCFTHYVPAPPK